MRARSIGAIVVASVVALYAGVFFPNTAFGLVIETNKGDRIIGSFAKPKLSIALTFGGTTQIDVKLIAHITGIRPLVISLKDGSTIRGTFADKTVAVKGIFGLISVPVSAIKSVSHGKRIVRFPKTRQVKGVKKAKPDQQKWRKMINKVVSKKYEWELYSLFIERKGNWVTIAMGIRNMNAYTRKLRMATGGIASAKLVDEATGETILAKTVKGITERYVDVAPNEMRAIYFTFQYPKGSNNLRLVAHLSWEGNRIPISTVVSLRRPGGSGSEK